MVGVGIRGRQETHNGRGGRQAWEGAWVGGQEGETHSPITLWNKLWPRPGPGMDLVFQG